MGTKAKLSQHSHILFRSRNENILLVGDLAGGDLKVFPGYTDESDCINTLALIASTHLALPQGLIAFQNFRQAVRREFEFLIDQKNSTKDKLKIAKRIVSDKRLSDLSARGWLRLPEDRKGAVKGISFVWLPELEDAETFIDYALALMLDEQLEFYKKIGICRLEECRRYYLKIPKKSPMKEKDGRPLEYCCSEHRDQNIPRLNRERQRKHQIKLRMKK